MRKRERAVVQTFRRVCDFVWSQRKAMPTHVVEKLLPQLRRTIGRLEELAVEQDLAMRLQMESTQRQIALAERLRVHYVLPLSRIARHISPGLGRALRAPHKRFPRERLARTASSMVDVAEHQAGAVAEILGRRFLKEMRAAATALDRAMAARDGPVRRHITARAGVEAELRKGRGTVRHIEALLLWETTLEDPVLASTWKRVKRYE
jgi:hypothetical protein